MSRRYDAVIVGAGSAGAVLAARLSADEDRSVLLLEAGPDHRADTTPDAIAGPNFFAALSEPGRMWPALQATHAAGQDPAPYLRGRGAGGSSAVNAMVALRGQAADYDRWAQDLGCAGWDASIMGELLDDVEQTIPMRATAPETWAPLDRALRAAALELGYEACADHDAEGSTGVGAARLTIDADGRRASTNDAYLEPVRDRSNLEVRGDALVDRVALDGARAVGVRLAGGEEVEAGEVLVCAGAIHSPALLLRSGIGGDGGLPVGENLVEHPLVPVGLVLAEQARLTSEQRVLSSLVRYSSGLAGAGPADMQILSLAIAGPEPELAGVGILGAAAMRVFSRGHVALRCDDPSEDPIVEFNMLADDRDRVRLRDGFDRLRALVAQPAIAEVTETALAGEAPLESIEDVDAHLDAAVTNYVHAVGTCRMGTPGDPVAVVDAADCTVLGHEALRVVDASVMPDIPRANTHLTTVAIAERVASLIATR